MVGAAGAFLTKLITSLPLSVQIKGILLLTVLANALIGPCSFIGTNSIVVTMVGTLSMVPAFVQSYFLSLVWFRNIANQKSYSSEKQFQDISRSISRVYAVTFNISVGLGYFYSGFAEQYLGYKHKFDIWEVVLVLFLMFTWLFQLKKMKK